MITMLRGLSCSARLRLFGYATLGAAVVGLGMPSAAADRAGDRGGSSVPLALFTWVADVGVPPDAGDEAINVLAQSWTLLNPAALAQIDPALADVQEMPLVSVQLFSDVAFTAQVTSARSLWMDVEPWNDLTQTESPPDGFELSAALVGPLAGHFVMISRAQGVFAHVHIDGVGSFRIRPATKDQTDGATLSPLHVVEHVESTNQFECLTGLLEQAAVDSGGGGEGGVAGSPGACPTTIPSCTGQCDEGCIIDLIAFYTQQAETQAGGKTNIETEVMLAVADANAAYAASKVGDGTTCDGHCTFARISPDGRYITYVSTTTNVIGGLPGDGKARIYVFDRVLSVTSLVSKDCDGNPTDDNSGNPAISNFAQFIAFDCLDTNMVKCGVPLACNASCDANGAVSDVIVRNLGSKGDLNGDGRINGTDQTIQNQNWGTCPCCASDLDHDGDVDNGDRSILTSNWTG